MELEQHLSTLRIISKQLPKEEAQKLKLVMEYLKLQEQDRNHLQKQLTEYAILMGVPDSGQYHADWKTRATQIKQLEEKQQNILNIHQEKMRRLEVLRKFVWEQFKRKIPEMKDIGKDLDFILAMPTFDPETGKVLTIKEALEYAQNATK